eukprot:15484736-Alexandrium_andersonii.AAC.1
MAAQPRHPCAQCRSTARDTCASAWVNARVRTHTCASCEQARMRGCEAGWKAALEHTTWLR